MNSRRPLRKNDAVAVIAPSGPFSPERLQAGIATLEARGYEVRRLLPAAPWRYLAGTDDERLRLIHEAFSAPDVRAVFAARGGYGATRLLERLDWELLVESGKPLIGFSDITALHLPLAARGVRSIHGPVVTRIGEEPPDSLDRLFSLLEDDGPPPPLRGKTAVKGKARGRLVGGCLSLVAALVGTPHLPDLSGCVLFLEEVGEHPYRVDRLLTQLLSSGVLDEVAGFAVGELTGCDAADLKGSQIVVERLQGLDKPLLTDLPFGHGDRNLALPHGGQVEIRDGALHFQEGIW